MEDVDYVTFTYRVPDERSDTRTVTVPASHFREDTDWYVSYYADNMRTGILRRDIEGEVVRWRK